MIREARNAERAYELISRLRAPLGFGWSGSGPCDEIVGRFCLRFDPDETPQPVKPEEEAVTKARERALGALERALAVAPRDGRSARGLVRLLVESKRDSAAAAVARRYAAAAPGLWADLLLGFALHAVGDDMGADSAFGRALRVLPEKERKRLSIEPLVSAGEAARLRKLAPAERANYEAALWKLADPLYLTPGNEVRAEHITRYVWSRLLAELPLVRGMTSWGWDLEELTFRYGVPTSRERVPGPNFFDPDNYVEHYDSQLGFLPESLLVKGVRPQAAPGKHWTLEDPRARSAYPLTTVRRMQDLPVQLTRFPAGDSVVLRVDGALALDSAALAAVKSAGAAARPAPGARAGLFLLPAHDAMLRGDTAVLRALRAPALLQRDSMFLSLSAALPPGSYIYSAELLEDGSRLAGRSRYSVTLPSPAPTGPLLSDILLARPFASARPRRRDDPLLVARPEAVAAAGDTLGLYAELTRLAPGAQFAVDLELVPEAAPPALARAWGWLRERLGGGGGSGRRAVVRASWSGQVPDTAAAPVPLATDVELPGLKPGLYSLRLHVTDARTGAAATAERLLEVRAQAPAAQITRSGTR